MNGVPGGTELTNRAELEGKGLAKVAAPFLGSRVGDAVAANLKKLKEILEGSPQGPARSVMQELWGPR